MATFKPNKDLEKQLMKAVQPQLAKIKKDVEAELRRKISAIERTHAGRPEREVLMALEKAERSVGVDKPNRAELTRLAKEISAKKPAG